MPSRDSTNPFEAPSESAGPRLVPSTKIVSSGKAIAILAGTTIFGGVVGAAIGALIGAVAPDYYRAIFRFAQSPEVNVVQLGFGLGLLQGGGLGVGVGLVLIAILCWYRSRLEYFTQQPGGFPADAARPQP